MIGGQTGSQAARAGGLDQRRQQRRQGALGSAKCPGLGARPLPHRSFGLRTPTRQIILSAQFRQSEQHEQHTKGKFYLDQQAQRDSENRGV